MAEIAKALGHPARIAIVELLLQKNACICGDLVDELPLAQATVSQHLKVLKDAGIIQGNIQKHQMCYCLNMETLATLQEFLSKIQESISPDQPFNCC